MTGGAIINFGDLGKPANTLIEKIAGAIEGISKPAQIKRLAKAQAEADLIKAESDINIHELKQRALSRFVAEETKKQDNMEKITEKALPLLHEDSDPKKMEDDWITNFFDKCRIISDTEMQTLWAKLLAGEANSPGEFSKRTVNLLGSLDKVDAQLFSRICGFVWTIEDFDVPLIIQKNDTIYKNNGIKFDMLNHLDDIGLITYSGVVDFIEQDLPNKCKCHYYERPLYLEFPNPTNNKIVIGATLFTKTGEQLQKICSSKPVDGFYDYVIEKWSKENIKLSSSISKNT
jgi:hypothetical protein